MEKDNLTHIYFIPGMSASSAIFERIQLPKNQYKTHLLEWNMPIAKNESLSDYVHRFSKQIIEKNPILIGVSFGGILAQEIAQIISCKKIILISSVKSTTEFRPFFKIIKAIQLYRLYPVSLLNFTEKLLFKNGSIKTKKTLNSYRKFIPIRNKLYTQWAISSFINWKGTNNNTKIIHLHGTSDKILPIKYIKNCEVVKNGTHIMVITKSSTIQKQLINHLA